MNNDSGGGIPAPIFHRYANCFMGSYRMRDIDMMNTLLEEHPSLVEVPVIHRHLTEFYILLRRSNSCYANNIYQAVLNSHLTDKIIYINRFDILDQIDDLKRRRR